MADREDSNVIDLREFRQTGERVSVQEIKDHKQVEAKRPCRRSRSELQSIFAI